jgi:hypothetical protein
MYYKTKILCVKLVFTKVILRCTSEKHQNSPHTGNLGRTCRINDAVGIENSPLCINIMYEGGLSVANFIFCCFLEKYNTK